jgi:hypothetical protein
MLKEYIPVLRLPIRAMMQNEAVSPHAPIPTWADTSCGKVFDFATLK